MITKDTPIAEKTMEKEITSNLELIVTLDNEEQVGMNCKFSNVSTTLLLQSIAYMIDMAYKGDKLIMNTVAEQIPAIVNEYIMIKEAHVAVDEAEETVDNVISNMPDNVLMVAASEELTKSTPDMAYLGKLIGEVTRRKENGNREGN